MSVVVCDSKVWSWGRPKFQSRSSIRNSETPNYCTQSPERHGFILWWCNSNATV